MYANAHECAWAKMTHIMGKNDTYSDKLLYTYADAAQLSCRL